MVPSKCKTLIFDPVFSIVPAALEEGERQSHGFAKSASSTGISVKGTGVTLPCVC